MNLKDAVDRVVHRATQWRPFDFPARSLRSARELTYPGYTLRVSAGPVLHVSDPAGQVTALDIGAVYALSGMISGVAFAPTTYGRVVDTPLFHALYDVQDRQLSYIEAGVPVVRVVRSAPCMLCGLVLPLRNLTVDHQRPQTGGDLEAVAKTFRAFGLTEEGPKGPKGRAILAHIAQGSPFLPVPTRPGRPIFPGGGSVDARYTLNVYGTVLYSFIAAAGDAYLARLRSSCLHGLLNLQPACSQCNSARGQQLKFT